MLKKNKNAFTLIEVLAIIVLLAIIALITIPNVNRYLENSKKQTFIASVESLINMYQYKSIDQGEKLGRVSPCTLDVAKCDNMNGFLDLNEYNVTTVNLTNNLYCAIGPMGSYDVKKGSCEGDEPPTITNISIINLTVSSATVVVDFYDETIIKSVRFRLLDSDDKVVENWKSAQAIDNSTNNRVAKIDYTGLTQNQTYKVEVEVKNNSTTSDTATGEETFTTLGFAPPVITYSHVWETEKDVTITYTDIDGVTNRYRVLTNNLFDLTEWKELAEKTKTLTISNYHYYVSAKSTSGNTNFVRTDQIGYIDNENDVNNTKPTIYVSEYKENGENTNKVSLTMADTLSGVGSYCISTVNNPSNCNGTGNNKDLNKWVVASSVAEVREKVMQHEIANSGVYYAFLKDFVGNLSNFTKFEVYKVTYDLNGGTGNLPYQIKMKGVPLTLRETIPTRQGYEFLGWDTNNANHTAAYNSKSTYTSDSNVTLYAIWRRTEVIKYNANGGEGSVDDSSCYRYNAEPTCEITFRKNEFARTGYEFKAWALGQNGATSYNAETKYSISSNVDKTYTNVYAGWKVNELEFNDQEFTKIFNSSAQTINIVGASNGNGNYQYSEVSEVNSNGTSTTKISISNTVITLSGSTPASTYTYVVKVTSPVSNNIDSLTSISKNATMTITVNPYNLSNVVIDNIPNLTYNGSEQTPTPKVTAFGSVTLSSTNDFTYSYTNNKNAGTGTVTITGKGNYIGTNSKTFIIDPKQIAVSWANASLIYNRTAQKPTASVTTGVTNETMTLSVSGEQTDYRQNAYSATATCVSVTTNNRCANYTLTNNTTDFSIAQFDLANATIADIAAVTYNGSEHKPEPKVTAHTSNAELVKGTDFTYSYSNNKNAGTATVTITGKGNYKGTNSKTFIINKKSIAVSWGNATFTYNRKEQKPTASVNTGVTNETMTLTVSGGATNYKSTAYTATASCSSVTTNDRCANYELTNTTKDFTIAQFDIAGATIATIAAVNYNGTQHKPKPAVTAHASNTTLTENTDFTYSYGTNINAGDNAGSVTINGTGNYKGSKTANFKINYVIPTGDVVCASLTYNGTNQGLISSTSTTLQSSDVYYAIGTKIDASNYNTVGSTKKPTAKDAGSYVVYWFAPQQAPGYLAKSDSVTCTISPKSVAVSWSNTSLTYNGSAQKPTASVTTGVTNETMTLSVSGEQTAYRSTAYSATATCASVTTNNVCGNYTLTNASTSFTIGQFDLTNATIASISALTYNGSAQTPTPKVTAAHNSTGLSSSTEFTYSYSNNKNAGTGTVTITGKGNYKGTKSANFTINKKSIAVTWTNTSFTYDKGSKIPTASVTTGITNETMTLNTTGAQTNAGTYTASTSCSSVTTNNVCGNYTLTNASTSFTIGQFDLTNATIASISAVTYNGSAQTPTPKVTTAHNSTGLSSSTEFTYSYSNNKNAGTGTVTITGKGNYKGTKTANFTINKKSIAVTWTNTSFTYNATSRIPTASVTTGITNETMTLNTTGAQTNAGTYTASTSCSSITTNNVCNNYTLTNASTNFTISAAALTITAKAQTINYGGSIATGTDQITSSGLVSGHSITGITLTPSTTNVTTNGTITPKDVVIKSGSTTISNSNYAITYKTGVLKINKIDPVMYLSSTSGQLSRNTSTTISVTGSNYGTLSCSPTSGNNIGTCSVSGTNVTIKAGNTSGTVTITVTGSGGTNYNSISKNYSLTVTSIRQTTKTCGVSSYSFGTANTSTVYSCTPSSWTDCNYQHSNEENVSCSKNTKYLCNKQTCTANYGWVFSHSEVRDSCTDKGATCNASAYAAGTKDRTCSTSYGWGSATITENASSCNAKTESCSSDSHVSANNAKVTCTTSTGYKTTTTTCNKVNHYTKTTRTCYVATYSGSGYVCQCNSKGICAWAHGTGLTSSSCESGATYQGTCSSQGAMHVTSSCQAYSYNVNSVSTQTTSCSATSRFECVGTNSSAAQYVGQSYVECSLDSTTYSPSTSTSSTVTSSCSATTKSCNSSTAGTSWTSACTPVSTTTKSVQRCTKTITANIYTCNLTSVGYGSSSSIGNQSSNLTNNPSCSSASDDGNIRYSCTENSDYTQTTKRCNPSYGFGSSSSTYVGDCTSSSWSTCDASHNGQTHYTCEY